MLLKDAAALMRADGCDDLLDPFPPVEVELDEDGEPVVGYTLLSIKLSPRMGIRVQMVRLLVY